MAHKTMVGGTVYDITGGRSISGSTVYEIDKGRTLIGGTAYDISFADLSVLYELATPLVGSGSTYIDTGIHLLETSMDWSIVCTYTSTAVSGWQTLFHCMYESGSYPGIVVDDNNSGSEGIFQVAWGEYRYSFGNVEHTSEYVNLLILNHDSSSSTLSVYSNGTKVLDIDATFTSVNSTLVLGAYKTTTGMYGRYFRNGTISSFILRNRLLTTNEIDAITTSWSNS